MGSYYHWSPDGNDHYPNSTFMFFGGKTIAKGFTKLKVYIALDKKKQ